MPRVHAYSPVNRRGAVSKQGSLAAPRIAAIVLGASLFAPPARAAEDAAAGPRSPAQELASFHLADPELTVELVAAEPEVESPVAICWDEHYAMYVAEMRDYPLGPTSGRIRKLTDRDGDGRYETSQVFAENLPFPNGLLFANGGLFVTAAPDLLFLQDTDGDGVADQRRVAWTGFHEGNQQLRANGLCWGLDGRIYGANGRSDGEIVPGDARDAPPISIRTRDFRFKPDGSAFEAIPGQSQFGQAMNDRGDRFLSWNTIPVRQMVFDAADVTRSPTLAARAVHALAPPVDPGEVFPLAPRPQTFNRESTSHFNALCGLTIFRGDALGEEYRGNAFVGESLSNLVHRRVLEAEGPTYVARRVEQNREFLAATDAWFHPVYLTTGPDGALYVVDFYRRWVEHPQFVPEAWRGEVAWQEGAAHGRIWRVRRSAAAPAATDRPVDAWRREGQSPRRLVELLAGATDGWHADTVQRLLLEEPQADELNARLRELSLATGVAGITPMAHARALSTLAAMNALDDATLAAALVNPAVELRERAARVLAASRRASETLAIALHDAQARRLPGMESPRSRFHLARAWAGFSGERKAQALVALLAGDDPGGWVARAVESSAGAEAARLLALLTERNAGTLPASQALLLESLAAQAAQAGGGQAIAAQARQTLAADPQRAPLAAVATLAGFCTRRGATDEPAGAASSTEGAPSQFSDQTIHALLDRLAALVTDDARDECRWLLAILLDDRRAATAARLAEQFVGSRPAGRAEQALDALARWNDEPASDLLVAHWPAAPPALRRQITAAALRAPAIASALLAALDRGDVLPQEIEPAHRATLVGAQTYALQQRVARLFATAEPPPRDEAIAAYQSALTTEGDRRRGAALFREHCQACHKMFGLGRQVGPDITGAGVKPKETLLVDILDPSRQVSPDHLAYTLVTRAGQVYTGLLVAESDAHVTLRRGEGADETIARGEIEQLAASGKSLMPEGLEQKLSPPQMADLLEFLRRPERALLESQAE